MRLLLRHLGFSLLLIALAGCGTPAEYRLDAPVLQVSGLTASGDNPTVVLRLINPNTVPLVVRNSTYTLHLGAKRVGRVEEATPIGLPAVGEITHTVTLPAALAAKIRAWLEANPGTGTLLVESTFVTDIGDDRTTVLMSLGTGTVQAP
jgi:LEA14-like dessication related protein